MENKMVQLAEMFGLELQDEFYIKYESEVKPRTTKFKINKDGFFCYHNGGWTTASNYILINMLKGNCIVIKVEDIPYMPKLHEKYWTIIGSFMPAICEWRNETEDYLRFKEGIVFKTYEEVRSVLSDFYYNTTGDIYPEDYEEWSGA